MKMLLFDIDGTLIRTGGAGIRALNRAFLQCHGLQQAMDLVRPAGKTDPAIMREVIRAHLGRDCSPDEIQALCNAYVHFLQEEMRNAPGYRLMPGIADILERAAISDSCLLGLVTGNLQQGARIKLERSDLNRYFQFGGYGSDSESRPELTRLGIQRGHRLQKHPSPNKDIVLIGDTPFDIDAGRQLGVVTIAVATGPWTAAQLQAHTPDFLFEDLSHTEGFFRSIGL